MTVSIYNDVVTQMPDLTDEEVDLKLEEAVIQSEKAEMLVCCYLAEVRERRLFVDFGYANISDYTFARFGFKERKTHYLVRLGKRIKHLPKLREAMANGKIGWCKASRLADFVLPENEVMWLESALSSSVQQLEQRIKDGTDTLATILHFPLSADMRILWEDTLEIFRRRAGAEISPLAVFEYLLAEKVAEWGHYLAPDKTPETPEVETPEPETLKDDATAPEEDDAPEAALPAESETETGPVFPWAEKIDTDQVLQPSLFESAAAAEADYEDDPEYKRMRDLVLERDGWKCTVPFCSARSQLTVHHIQYRSRGVCHSPWNLTTVCTFHHALIHKTGLGVKGRAPNDLVWTFPKLMQAVLDRRRDRPSIWLGELDVRECSLETRAGPKTTDT